MLHYVRVKVKTGIMRKFIDSAKPGERFSLSGLVDGWIARVTSIKRGRRVIVAGDDGDVWRIDITEYE